MTCMKMIDQTIYNSVGIDNIVLCTHEDKEKNDKLYSI